MVCLLGSTAAVGLVLPRQARFQTPTVGAMRAETLPDRPATVAALLRVVLAGACWASAAVLAKYAFERGVPPVRLAEARVAVALVAIAPVLAWRRPDLLRPPPGTWPALAGFGACVAAVNFSYYQAIDHLPVGVAVALQYAGLASAVLFAAYLLAAELAGRRGAEPATTLLWGFLAAVDIWAVAAPWWSWPVGVLADPGVAGAVVAVGLLGTLLPFALAVGAVRVISAATAGIAATSEPVFAVVFAWVLLGQRLNLAQLAGAA